MIPLHVHSMYSVLDGLGKPADIVARAKELGMSAVAITDHGNISALPDLFKAAKEAGIKPIIGCEFYVVDKAEGEKGEMRHHLSVWPKNWAGVQSVMRMLTVANRQFYKRPRITWDQAMQFENCIIGTACIAGPLSHDNWDSLLECFQGTYGSDFYVEIMPPSPDNLLSEEDQAFRNKVVGRAIRAFNGDFGQGYRGIPILATNDAHYVRAEDAKTHEILLAVQTGKKWDDPKRWTFGFGELYLKNRMELIQEFNRTGMYPKEMVVQGIVNTHKVESDIWVDVPDMPVELPAIEANLDDEAKLKSLVMEGWGKLVVSQGVDEKAYLKRLLYELGVIRGSGYVRYFLIVWDMISWARSQGIMVGPGRGSAAGSLVSWLLGITQVDPIRHGLLFERFLNPDRVSMPDIDVDFQDNRRGEVFKYIREKYGPDYTAHIGTFGKLTVKNAFRDVCRVFDVDNMKVNMLSKQIEGDDAFEEVPELASFSNAHPEIVEQAKRLDGVVRQVGVHACGVVISSRPLTDVCVVEHRKSDVEVTNWDGRVCEKFGLLKVDVLGLGTLTTLSLALSALQKRGIDPSLVDLPLDDEKTLRAFSEGRGVGIFQFENAGMQGLLRAIDVKTFEDITACTALYRPGPLESGWTERYKNIARGAEYETYDDPRLEPILKETKGVVIYQEQVMRIATDLAGYTLAQADGLRKIMGKKLVDKVAEEKPRFVNGCIANGMNESMASRLFDQLAEFSKYGFNKSHATAYTIISYWTMYLKVHYPLEFFAATMSVSADDRVRLLVEDAEKHGILIKRPDVNLSELHYAVDYEDNAIVPPLGAIKGVGNKAVDVILKARAGELIECVTAKKTTIMEGRPGPFLSLEDFQERVYKRVVNKRIVDFLTRAGAFESLAIRTENEEERAKDFADLLPTFRALPKIPVKGGDMDKARLEEIARACAMCGKKNDRDFLPPVPLGARPTIMVINNNTKREREHLETDATSFFLKEAKKRGVPKSAIYYTGPLKCYFPRADSAPKDCTTTCMENLREEILAVKPKLIVCFASQVSKMFASGKAKGMKDLHGSVEYCREFDAYVLFSFSPQYASFKEEIEPMFLQAMDIMGNMCQAAN